MHHAGTRYWCKLVFNSCHLQSISSPFFNTIPLLLYHSLHGYSYTIIGFFKHSFLHQFSNSNVIRWVCQVPQYYRDQINTTCKLTASKISCGYWLIVSDCSYEQLHFTTQSYQFFLAQEIKTYNR